MLQLANYRWVGDSLRKPFYVVALILTLLVVGVETGSSWLMPAGATEAQLAKIAAQTHPPVKAGDLPKAQAGGARPGLGIRYLAVLDVLVLLFTILIGTAQLLPQSLQARIAALVTLIVTLVVIVGGIVLIMTAVALLFLMVGLFVATPFGTLVYLGVWGFFDRGSASTILGVILFLKLGAAVFLVLAHQDFLKNNRGWLVLTLVSLATTVIVSFLQGIVPGILTSITDAVAAIVVGAIGVLWALFMLVGSIVSLIKGLRVRPA
jgi:hypothetical protein